MHSKADVLFWAWTNFAQIKHLSLWSVYRYCACIQIWLPPVTKKSNSININCSEIKNLFMDQYRLLVKVTACYIIFHRTYREFYETLL